MTFTGYDDIIYRSTALGQTQAVDFQKTSQSASTATANHWYELFTGQGTPNKGSFGTMKYPLSSGTPNNLSICAGADGNAYCTDNNASLWQITSSGITNGLSVNIMGLICLGSDNNLWLCATNSATVNKYVVSTQATTVINLTSGTPGGIGSDGTNLWVGTSGSTNNFYKITTGGSVSAFTLAGSPTFRGMCYDGTNLWSADGANGGIWKIATDGSGTHYTLTSSSGFAVCYGPDGNVWMTDGAIGNGVWKVNTSTGVGTQYTITGAGLRGICSDGTNLWAVDIQQNSVWKITTGGVATQYLFTASGGLYGICLAPNNTDLLVNDSTGVIWKIPTSINPGKAIAMNSSTQGALYLNSNVSPSTRHLLNICAWSSGAASPGELILCDFLLYYPSLVVTGTPTVPANNVVLPRYATGAGVQAACFVQTALGAASPALTFTFTAVDSAGSTHSGQTAVMTSPANSAPISTALLNNGNPFFPIPSGYTGIQSIQSYTIASGTTGTVAALLYRPIMQIPLCAQYLPSERDCLYQLLSMPQIFDGACLGFMVGIGGAMTTLQTIAGRIQYVYN